MFADARSSELRERIERIGPSWAPVLITGETGTGKELVAREIHARSGRADKPFVAVNAGALSEHLIESELFGHEKGAFTGAHASQVGWFEAADGGTLFLDEIGDLPMSLQVKLLRVLSTGEVTRLGSRTPTPVDVRLIAATNVDLLEAMRARRFREDLYYRLSVTGFALPPLRERPGDVLPLAQHFLERYGERLGRHGVRLGRTGKEALLRHAWPGNIRELENTIHQGLLVCRSNELEASDLCLVDPLRRDDRHCLIGQRPWTDDGLAPNDVAAGEFELGIPESGLTSKVASVWAPLERMMVDLLALGVPDLQARIESTLLAAAYQYSGQNQLETARLLGWSRHVVRARLIEHGLLSGQVRKRGSNPVRRLDIDGPGPARGLLRVGYQKLGLLMLLEANGAFDAALGSRGVDVAWREYAGGIQLVEALQRGEVDVCVVGDCPAVYAQAERVPVVYVAAEPPAHRVAALLVPHHSAAKSVRDLRGKRIAVNRAAQAHYLLMLALEEAGMDNDAVEVRFEPPDRAWRAFEDGDVDAWAIWDPWLSSARLDLGARVLRDTSGLFESSVYYLARREVALRHPDWIGELCTQLRCAARWVASDPGRAARTVAPRLGLSPLALAASLDRELCSIGITPAQLATQQRIADHCVRLRMIPRAVSVAAAQWPEALAG